MNRLRRGPLRLSLGALTSVALALVTARPSGAESPPPDDALSRGSSARDDAPREGWPQVDGTVPLAQGGTLRVQDAAVRLHAPGASPVDVAVAAEQSPAISGDGRRFVLVHRENGAFCSVLDAWELLDGVWTGPRRLESEGCPDRAALHPEGDLVAYVSGRTGIASLYLVAFAGGSRRQLTNVGLQDRPPTPGQAPPGFVPPPHLGPPSFLGRSLVWSAPDGEHWVRLP